MYVCVGEGRISFLYENVPNSDVYSFSGIWTMIRVTY